MKIPRAVKVPPGKLLVASPGFTTVSFEWRAAVYSRCGGRGAHKSRGAQRGKPNGIGRREQRRCRTLEMKQTCLEVKLRKLLGATDAVKVVGKGPSRKGMRGRC